MNRIGKALPILFWLLIWEAAARLINSRLLLASPVTVLLRLGELMRTPRFWLTVGNSAWRIALGFLLAALLALALAVCADRQRAVRALLAPMVSAMRSIPVASFIVLALIWFTSRRLSLLIAFLVAFPVLYTAVQDALSQRDAALHVMAAAFGVRGFRRWRYLDAFELLPGLRTAVRTAVGMCVRAGVASEILGVPRLTIGEALQQAKLYLNTADVLAWTAAVLLLGWAFERLAVGALRFIENKALSF